MFYIIGTLLVICAWTYIVIKAFTPSKEQKEAEKREQARREWIRKYGTTEEKILLELQVQNEQQGALAGLLGLWFIRGQ